MFDDQDCYVMDAKSMGNLGRYLNVRLKARFHVLSKSHLGIHVSSQSN